MLNDFKNQAEYIVDFFSKKKWSVMGVLCMIVYISIIFVHISSFF